MVSGLTPRLSAVLPKHFVADVNELENLFETFFNGEGGCRTNVNWTAPATLWEDNDAFHLDVELPGVANGDVDVTLEKGVLKVSAVRNTPESERKVWYQERRFGRFERHFKLPELVNPESIDARLADGVLSVTLAKRPELQPKKIQIRTAS
jgi:HSP20 family protein